jgi:hypothetical protein
MYVVSAVKGTKRTGYNVAADGTIDTTGNVLLPPRANPVDVTMKVKKRCIGSGADLNFV